MCSECGIELTQDEFFEPWTEELRKLAEAVSEHANYLELDQDWSTVDAVMLGFALLAKRGVPIHADGSGRG